MKVGVKKSLLRRNFRVARRRNSFFPLRLPLRPHSHRITRQGRSALSRNPPDAFALSKNARSKTAARFLSKSTPPTKHRHGGHHQRRKNSHTLALSVLSYIGPFSSISSSSNHTLSCLWLVLLCYHRRSRGVWACGPVRRGEGRGDFFVFGRLNDRSDERRRTKIATLSTPFMCIATLACLQFVAVFCIWCVLSLAACLVKAACSSRRAFRSPPSFPCID